MKYFDHSFLFPAEIKIRVDENATPDRSANETYSVCDNTITAKEVNRIRSVIV